MGVGVFVHHVGTLLLLIATALLIVASISAPVVDSIAILRVNLPNGGGHVNFGTFGWCLEGAGGNNMCTKKEVGYSPSNLLTGPLDYHFSKAARDTAKALTRVMVLHAVAAGIDFVAFLVCLGTSCLGSLCAALMAVVAFIITVVVLITDFVAWSIIKHDVNDHTDGSASYGPAIWCVLVAGVATALGAILVFVTCCAGRIRDKRHSHTNRRDIDKYGY